MLKFRTHGKWILAGEHSVLRGGSALVFPVRSRFLDFNYLQGQGELKLEMNVENQDLVDAFWRVFDRALNQLSLSSSQIKGCFQLSSNIPVGAGMGASATLCVSLAHFFAELGFLNENEKYHFAKDLENLFHGESSGVDVAVALKNQALEFRVPEQMTFFNPIWNPHFYLSYSGKKGITSDCVTRVQNLIKQDQVFGDEVDFKMKCAVEKSKSGLMDIQKKDLLIEGIDLALQCFEQWGLVSVELKSHMAELKKAGAIAVKPTGSGEGGFVLSLWEDDQAPEKLNLIKAF